MNKGELRTMVIGYLKRSDFSSIEFDQWVRFANVRIGRSLRGQDNLVSLAVTPTVNPVALPLDYRAMRSVESSQNNSTFRLRAMDAAFNTLPLSGGGFAIAYRIRGFQMELRPFAAMPLNLEYWQAPAELVTDNQTNAVLTAQPMLYLYAVLMEGAVWAQDANAAQAYAGVFGTEVEELNIQGQNANLGDTPTMGN